MSKKKSDSSKHIEFGEIEPAEVEHENAEPVLSEVEAPVPVEAEVVEAAPQPVEAETGEEVSSDDLLEDVRKSLIEEETQKQVEEKPKWWKRIGKGGSKGQKSEEVTPIAPVSETVAPSVVGAAESQQGEYAEQIDELIDMLETDDADKSPGELIAPLAVVQIVEEKPFVEEEVVSVEELKKRAFRGSAAEDREENFSEVRAVALEGGEEVFIEVEAKAEDPMQDRLKAFENALRPYRRYIYFGIAFIAFVVIVITSGLMYDTYKKSLPPPTAEEADLLPYPVSMNLPGGLAFNLGRGTLDDGRWNPRGPEWLEGTEICRWVAIPYSRQLEAVVRTLTQDDQIELFMSNNDRLAYNVYSINQLSIEEMQDVSSKSPCLLLVLAESDTDKRWVVTGLP
jgi:hypothetical protein